MLQVGLQCEQTGDVNGTPAPTYICKMVEVLRKKANFSSTSRVVDLGAGVGR